LVGVEPVPTAVVPLVWAMVVVVGRIMVLVSVMDSTEVVVRTEVEAAVVEAAVLEAGAVEVDELSVDPSFKAAAQS